MIYELRIYYMHLGKMESYMIANASFFASSS